MIVEQAAGAAREEGGVAAECSASLRGGQESGTILALILMSAFSLLSPHHREVFVDTWG